MVECSGRLVLSLPLSAHFERLSGLRYAKIILKLHDWYRIKGNLKRGVPNGRMLYSGEVIKGRLTSFFLSSCKCLKSFFSSDLLCAISFKL